MAARLICNLSRWRLWQKCFGWNLQNPVLICYFMKTIRKKVKPWIRFDVWVRIVHVFASAHSQSEEDKQLQEDLEMMVERLSVSICLSLHFLLHV